jgi:threonylcarbamoyladenosine tRNA methylthiotransferase MtaB
MLERTGVGKLHAFPFSVRAGTPASLFEDLVPAPVVRSRMSRALSLGSELLRLYSRRWVGTNVEVLVERNEGGSIDGLSRHYLRTWARGDSPPGEIATVRIEDSQKGILQGLV